jgi:glycine dehydrogenase subunit 2
MNLHKTFSTPHGGGGPGAGPVGVNDRLIPFLPVPYVAQKSEGYYLQTEKDCPQTIGRLSAFMGNAGVLIRAYVYARLLGREGMQRVADYSTLNSNYLMVKLAQAGFDMALPTRRGTHEFILTLKRQAKEQGVNAMDYAKRLLDYGFHAPTTYFPLIVPECLLIEPTESESKQVLDKYVEAMIKIDQEAKENPELVKGAPYTLPVRRLDDVKAAREINVAWQAEE